MHTPMARQHLTAHIHPFHQFAFTKALSRLCSEAQQQQPCIPGEHSMSIYNSVDLNWCMHRPSNVLQRQLLCLTNRY